MVFITSLILAIIFVCTRAEKLRKSPVRYYWGCVILAIAGILLTWLGVSYPAFFSNYILPIVARGGLAGALFIIVMVAGALPNKSAAFKKLYPIRGNLAIMASILTFGHNIAYGKTYFVMLFTGNADLPSYLKGAAIVSLCMIVLIIPLFITSFNCVRRKMNAKLWKWLQRLSYLFYYLLYAHIMMVTSTYAAQGLAGYPISYCLYSFVFTAYFYCRLLKLGATLLKRDKFLPHLQLLAALACAVKAVMMFVAL